MTPDYAPLFYWVREREKIRWQKDNNLPMDNSADGQPFWTDDPILKTYRFCNVRREDDRGTVWIRKNIRERFADHPNLWLMLCIGRQINWPETLAQLISDGAWPDQPSFSLAEMTTVLNKRKTMGQKVYTGAYMISAPSTKGADKQAYIAEEVIGDLWRRREVFERHFSFSAAPTLQRTHELLMRSNGWGPFMAYQAVVDMRFTGLLRAAPDIETWAAAGPGTLRGLNRLHGRAVDASIDQFRALVEMRAIYKMVQQETGVDMDFSDVPNILCETDKYLRVQNGEGKPRALYVPGRGY